MWFVPRKCNVINKIKFFQSLLFLQNIVSKKETKNEVNKKKNKQTKHTQEK